MQAQPGNQPSLPPFQRRQLPYQVPLGRWCATALVGHHLLSGGVTAVAGTTLAAALAADPAAEVFIVQNNVADTDFNQQGTFFAAMFPATARSLANDYAGLEARLLAADGVLGLEVAGLDAAVAVGEQVLLVLDDGMASVVLRYTALAGDADVITAGELDLVALLTNTPQMGVADFI